MRPLSFVVVAFLTIGSSCSQTPQQDARDAERPQSRSDLFLCEGCEAIYEHPHDDLDRHVTIPGQNEPGEPLVLTGQVVHPDGTTPAPDVVMYVYHTNADGVYPTRGDETGWKHYHGYLRGWLKTDAEGRYEIRTIRPGTYPSRTEPAHVHVIVKEPERQEYWIDSFHFEGDPLLTAEVRAEMDDRGGSGIVELTQDEEGVWYGHRNIVLEW